MDSPFGLKAHSISGCSPKLQQERLEPMEWIRQLKNTHHRSARDVAMLADLIKDNQIFKVLPFSHRLIEQICSQAEVVIVEDACKLQCLDEQLIMMIEGTTYEYIYNSQPEAASSRSGSRKRTRNQEDMTSYALIRKIRKNDYFTGYCPMNRYPTDQKKMQIVSDAQSVYLRINEDLFHRYFSKKLQFYLMQTYNILRDFDIIRDLKKNLIYELGKYVERLNLPTNYTLYKRGDKSDYFYFLRSGNILLKEDKDSGLEKGNLNKKYVVKSTTNTLLLESGSVVGVDGILVNVSSDCRMYTAETTNDVELLRIDKRPLIVLISCYNQAEPDQRKQINEVNLMNQVGEQEFQRKQYEMLQENVKKIQTSQKKVRDIKLRNLSTAGISKRKSMTAIRNEDYEVRNTAMTAQATMRHTTSARMRNTIRHEPTESLVPQQNDNILLKSMHSWFNQPQQFVNNIVMTPDHEEEQPALSKMESNNTSINGSFIKPNRQNKSLSTTMLRNGMVVRILNKQMKDAYIINMEKKRNNDLKMKLIAAKEDREDQKQMEMVRVKRMFNGSRTKIRRISGERQQKIDDTLVNKMSNLADNPLLFQMQSMRKKLIEGSKSFVLRSQSRLEKKKGQDKAHVKVLPEHKENYSSKILVRE